MKIVECIEVPKKRSEWSQVEKEESHKNKKALSVLMSRKEGRKIQHYISAKEMWETLENHYEGNI